MLIHVEMGNVVSQQARGGVGFKRHVSRSEAAGQDNSLIHLSLFPHRQLALLNMEMENMKTLFDGNKIHLQHL